MSIDQLSPAGRFDKLLLAVDTSEYGAGARRLGVAMAAKAKAKLYAMTMVLTNPEYEAIAPQLVEKAEEQAWSYLDRVVAEAKALGVDCEPVVCTGEDPAHEIVEQAKDFQVDAVIMGRRGRRGLARLMVGDATVKVIGNGNCSVLVVPSASNMWSKRLLLATDGSRYSDTAAMSALTIARCCETPIVVVGAMVPSHSDKRQEEGRQAVRRTAELLRSEGVAAEEVIGNGEADQVIVGAARDKGCDLIVLGSYGRTGFGRVLVGSVAERVLGQTACPVMVVK